MAILIVDNQTANWRDFDKTTLGIFCISHLIIVIELMVLFMSSLSQYGTNQLLPKMNVYFRDKSQSCPSLFLHDFKEIEQQVQISSQATVYGASIEFSGQPRGAGSDSMHAGGILPQAPVSFSRSWTLQDGAAGNASSNSYCTTGGLETSLGRTASQPVSGTPPQMEASAFSGRNNAPVMVRSENSSEKEAFLDVIQPYPTTVLMTIS